MYTIVYVDILVFINTIITYAVLMTAEKIFKRGTKLYRLILAALIGSLFSLLLFLKIQGFFFSLLIKAASSLLISLIAFPFVNIREYGKTTLAVIIVSVVYSGLFILFYQLFRPPNMAVINDVVYFEFNPLILVALTAGVYILLSLFHKLFRERIKSSVVRLEVKVGNTAVSCPAKIDTGCNLTEPFSGAPIIIIDDSLIDISDLPHQRVIPFSTVGGSSILYAVKSEKTIIDGNDVDRDIYIAATHLPERNFQAIINPEIIR